MPKTALILGVGGQDGSYLADILLERGYNVVGLYRKSSYDNLTRLGENRKNVTLWPGDITDSARLLDIMLETGMLGGEIYNVADQDDIRWSDSIPEVNLSITLGGVLNLLRTTRLVFGDKAPRNIRVFQPVSSTIFGNAPPPQDEETPLDPRSHYAVMKAAAYHLCNFYRIEHGLHIVTGIMYNHDSPRRHGGYLLQELATQAIEVRSGKRKHIKVGDPDAVVDIGYAGEYMEAVVDLMQFEQPGTYVVGTGKAWTVGRLAEEALGHLEQDTSLVRTRDDNFRKSESQLVANPTRMELLLNRGMKHTALGVLKMIIDYKLDQEL